MYSRTVMGESVLELPSTLTKGRRNNKVENLSNKNTQNEQAQIQTQSELPNLHTVKNICNIGTEQDIYESSLEEIEKALCKLTVFDINGFNTKEEALNLHSIMNEIGVDLLYLNIGLALLEFSNGLINEDEMYDKVERVLHIGKSESIPKNKNLIILNNLAYVENNGLYRFSDDVERDTFISDNVPRITRCLKGTNNKKAFINKLRVCFRVEFNKQLTRLVEVMTSTNKMTTADGKPVAQELALLNLQRDVFNTYISLIENTLSNRIVLANKITLTLLNKKLILNTKYGSTILSPYTVYKFIKIFE